MEALRHTHACFATLPAQVVTVCDREGDMDDLFLRARQLDRPLLVRARNRVVNKSATHSKISGEKLTALFDKKKASGSLQIRLPKSKDKPAREAVCDVKVTEITMTPPRNHAKPADGKLPHLSLYAVRVVEKKPPSGSDPVDWLLVTSLKVKTLEQAVEKVKWYCLKFSF
ncbi:MAG: IS4 family transposase, partial [Myxococcota bacterium]